MSAITFPASFERLKSNRPVDVRECENANIKHRMFLAGIFLGLTACLFEVCALEAPKMELVSETTENGRKVIRYEHDTLAEWNYEGPQRDYFYLVPPTKPSTGKVPLKVILHSAGRSAKTEMLVNLNPQRPTYFQAYWEEDFYGLYLDCDTHKTLEHWWGHKRIATDAKSLEKFKTELTPTEKRLFATLDWVMRTFPIDPDRVYLCGVSMGGSGSLGLGMPRGDLFAAINVLCPAYPRHGLYRSSNGKHPDPPPIFNFSSQDDPWAREEEQLIAHCQNNKYAMAFAWGPHGHTCFVDKFNASLVEFPWLTIRRNEAYPVFTSASIDNKYPGFKNLTAPDQNGQINAFFRWKNITDTPTQFAMELRLVKKEELLKPGDLECPVTSFADVSLRRLQKFKVTPGMPCKWQMIADGKVRQSGESKADSDGLLTIPKLTIEATPGQLKVELKK
jgi:dienelactone hydrolase